MKRLIVNADDFGFTAEVNRGIVDAYRQGVLRSTTLMANGAAFDDAVERARLHPRLDIGCHLTLIGGRSVLHPQRPLPGSVPAFLRALASGFSASRIEDELAAQVEKILAAGLHPTHLDTHKHTHLAPPVLHAVLSIGARYGIPWIRRPFDTPIFQAPPNAPWSRQALQRALKPLEQRLLAAIRRAGLRTTDAFWGFQLTGACGEGELEAVLARLPDGVTELMTHPGYCDQQLLDAPTRLKQSRRLELDALRSDRVAREVERAGVQLCGFGELGAASPRST